MHELSVCIALMEQVERIAREHEAAQVDKIVLQLGPLSGVEADLLRHAWPLASVGTLAESAELVIDSMPVKVKCTHCGAISEVPPNRLLCADCGDFRTRLLSGDEMLLANLELSQIHQPTESQATCV
ncbi:MAG: hydrogenase maturation nickel metallochaperone HypA [gamma proteobacterium symbiont of Bathyaustriella thionipta]|nr:hydrogenase maturation nickel metallochaperone HypA [gamma proteobacterium symbiont of Bathyaustriella thionipta]